jgi:hypothetical protein
MSGRVNPIGNLDDFAPTSAEKKEKPVEPEVIDQLARDNGFPSRQAVTTGSRATVRSGPPRRYLTGRNQQINIKATADTIERLYRKADELNVPLGEVLERALAALEEKG